MNLPAIAKITKSRIEAGFRYIKSLRFGRNDVVEVRFVLPPGMDTAPIANLRTLIIPTTINGKQVSVGVIATNQEVDPGEIKIFSVNDSDELQGFVLVNKDGEVHLNGDADTAVKYTELKSAFDDLKGDLNTFITLFNSHIHPDPVSGTTGTPTAAATPSTADMSSAEESSVKLGS